MRGGADGDTYVVDNAFDTVDEASLGGGTGGLIDTVQSSVTFSLVNSARVLGELENLTLTGGSAINGTGNALTNIITGNNAANTLDGGAGNDTLRGMGGNDILIGGLGKDTMTGGANNDIFRFGAATHSAVGANADVITDFDDFGDDRIDVSALFGPAMTYRHNGAFTAAGQVRINDIAGADLLVEVNTGGQPRRRLRDQADRHRCSAAWRRAISSCERRRRALTGTQENRPAFGGPPIFFCRNSKAAKSTRLFRSIGHESKTPASRSRRLLIRQCVVIRPVAAGPPAARSDTADYLLRRNRAQAAFVNACRPILLLRRARQNALSIDGFALGVDAADQNFGTLDRAEQRQDHAAFRRSGIRAERKRLRTKLLDFRDS